MKNKKGITLIALVVTIIVLLILAAVSISLIMGPDGVVAKGREAKIDSRYSSIIDRVTVRNSSLEVSNRLGEVAESGNDFILSLIDKKLIDVGEGIGQDEFDENIIYLGRKSDGSFKYTIHISDSNIDLAEMVLKIRTNMSNEEVEIPISNSTGLTINWGEIENSEYQTPNNEINPSFTYPTQGEYIVKIKGKVQQNTIFGVEDEFLVNNASHFIELLKISDDASLDEADELMTVFLNKFMQQRIVGILAWGENGFYKIHPISPFLTGTIPNPSTKSFENVNTFLGPFMACAALTGNIPANLFSNCPNVTNFIGTFLGCENLTGNIPANLFSNCPNVINFIGTFSGCENLTGNIPANLFNNCSKVINFIATFLKCENLTGNIPATLFSNSPNAENFMAVFSVCSNLTGNIPATLFNNSNNAINFNRVFFGCRNLTGSIPANLFSNCPNVVDFTLTFYNCEGLTGSIPTNLFTPCPNVLSFVATFESCVGLTGNAPELWNTHTAITFESCFRWCTSLTNRYDIPSSWGGLGN